MIVAALTAACVWASAFPAFAGEEDDGLLSRGMQGDAVYDLQQALYDLGYLDEWPDGEFGQMTYEAVIWFQEENGIEPVSGVAGPLTLDALYSDPVPAPAYYTGESADDDEEEGYGAGYSDDLIYGGTYIITSALRYLALDVDGDSVYGGANVQLYDCVYSGAQKWVLQDAGGGYYRIRNLRSWKCLDLNNDNAVQSVFDQFSRTQLWYLEEDGYGFYNIINADGLYLDVADSDAYAGANVCAYPEDGSVAQQWALERANSRTALDFTEDGVQSVGIRSFDIYHGNVAETTGYYNIHTSIYIPEYGYNLSAGSIGLKVMDVNRYLANAGFLDWDYYNYNRFDHATEEAVIEFQQAMDLYADGTVGVETWMAMGYDEQDFYDTGRYTAPVRVYAYGSSRDVYISAMLETAAVYEAAGTGYADGAAGAPGTYVDCSGLIYQCLYSAGINPDINIIDHAMAEFEYASYYLGNDWQLGELVDEPEPGDLIFYGDDSIDHVALYAGDGMIYDSSVGRGVAYRGMYEPGEDILKIVRVF